MQPNTHHCSIASRSESEIRVSNYGSVEISETNSSIQLKKLWIPAQPGAEGNARNMNMLVVG